MLEQFTFFISACGKTSFVKDLLRHHEKIFQPLLHRIVWLYKRWQPLYSEIQRAVSPRVEFIQGIPSDLDDDDYFDSRLNNLLILDDLFSEAGKDKTSTELFTEGSHHRNLSVISINQNPTQRRNCHYILFFKQPVDRQSVMTLTRQMYPGHADKFMKTFEKATKYPYGYLLVDLKPFTPDADRLRHDVTWADEVGFPMTVPIKEELISPDAHSSVGTQTEHNGEEHIQAEEVSDNMADKGHACDDCGLLFDTTHDVQRHIKSGNCPKTRNHCLTRGS